MAVTCHLGLERGVSNGSGRGEREREKERLRQSVRGCIKTIRDEGLRWQLLRVEEEQAER